MREINLLPPSRRRKLRQAIIIDTAQRFFRHLQIALLVMILMGVAVIGWLQIAITLAASDAEDAIPEGISQYQNIRRSIIEKNNLVKAVAAIDASRLVWSDNISELLTVLPPGTHISSIAVGNPANQVRITGTAVNRSSLDILRNRLEQLSWAQTVSAPLDNLLVRDRPAFTFFIQPRGVGTASTPAPEEN